MSNKRPPIPVIVLLVLAIASGLAYYFYPRSVQAGAPQLSASGTVEATEVRIAPETAGKVAEVLVGEGDQVQAGQALFRLDGSLLDAQRKAAAAALETASAAVTTANAAVTSAQAQYDSALFTAQSDEQTRRLSDWQLVKPADFNQPSWYFARSEQLQTTQDQASAAQSAAP